MGGWDNAGAVAERLELILDKAPDPFTSWNEFEELRNAIPELEDATVRQIFGAIHLGVERGILRARWIGVGMTPWAGSARRQRTYSRVPHVFKAWKAGRWRP